MILELLFCSKTFLPDKSEMVTLSIGLLSTFWIVKILFTGFGKIKNLLSSVLFADVEREVVFKTHHSLPKAPKLAEKNNFLFTSI